MNIAQTFFKKRVISASRRVPEEYGYVGFRTISENLLQVGVGPFWFTVEREEIPSDIVISHGAFGQDNSGWTSKFKSYM